MNPQQPNSMPGNNPIGVMQRGEEFVCEIKRHPIGIIGIFIASGLLIVLFAIIIFIVVPQVFTNQDLTKLHSVGAAVFVLLSLLVLGFTFIANKVYQGNRWIVTSDSITQMTQTGLFSRESSQLSLDNLEDVTAEQNGILTHIFNYGVLKCETAGERSKFQFLFCPNPTMHAQKVLDARERFEQHIRNNEARSDYQEMMAAQQQQQQSTTPTSY